MLDKYIFDKTIYVTFTNHAYTNYIINLYHSTLIAKVPWKLLIIATDSNAQNTLKQYGIDSVLLDLKMPEAFTVFDNRPDFNTICFKKLDIVKYVMKESEAEHVVYLDGDIWVMQDFSRDLEHLKEEKYDIVFQCDEPHKNACANPCYNMCMGFFMIHRSQTHLIDYSKVSPKQYVNTDHDQAFMKDQILNHQPKFTTFCRQRFPNGKFCKTFDPKRAAILHYNWLEGDEKRKQMMANNHWYVKKKTLL